MATSALDVRDTFAAPRVRVPANEVDATSATDVRRLPAAVVAAGVVGVVESVGLLAVALTGLDGVLSSVLRPAGWLVAGGLVVLAAWIVLCAGSAAALIDGAGRTLLMGVAYAEIALVALLLIVATAVPFETPAALPLPALGLLALAVPVGKLLLAGAPSTQRWVAEGPRPKIARPDPVQAHGLLATVTLGIIGFSLGAVALLTPVESAGSDGGAPASAVFQP